MTFSQFIAILRARLWAALLVLALVVATAVGVSLVLPKKYTATATVLVDVKPDPISAMGLGAVMLPAFMATQVDILNSDRVALRVIKDLKLADNATLRQEWQEAAQGRGTFEQWLGDALQKSLDVKPSRESNVIAINYSSPDPRFAAGLANAFAQAYMATTLELRVDPARQFASFFNVQAKDARDALERAQSRLSAYQREKGLTATDERLDVENARLNELSSQLTQLQAISAESRSREVQAQGAQADRLQDVLNNPLIAGLKAELSRSEAKLQELSQRLGDAHPQVVEAKASINELRSRVDAETRRVTASVGLTNTINQGREGQVRAALAAQRSRVLELKALRDEGLVLQREVEAAQRTFESVANRMNQTTLEAQATQSYVNLLAQATPPVQPSSPKLLLNTALAIFLGTLLAVGTALLLELMDRRIRTVDDVVAALGLPVLGTLPTPKAKRYVAGLRMPPALPDARTIQEPGLIERA